MKYVKVIGLVWGLIYFVFGALKSFTLNGIDFWTSVALLFSLFLLPLPIGVIAFWSEKIARNALLFCVAVSLVAAAGFVAGHWSLSFSGKTRAFAVVALYTLPHFAFAMIYILTGRAKNVSIT